MKLVFGLGWTDARIKSSAKAFKDQSAATLFEKYQKRIDHDFSCDASPMLFEELKEQAGLIWVCERVKKSRMLTSDEVASRFQKVCDSGAKSLTVWIGGPDGLSADQMNSVRPDLIWSFGPMTLPHELAAVVAAEQIYRAVSILKNHPYHTGH